MLSQEIIQQWLCVDQTYELFTDIMGRGGASNVYLQSVCTCVHGLQEWQFYHEYINELRFKLGKARLP